MNSDLQQCKAQCTGAGLSCAQCAHTTCSVMRIVAHAWPRHCPASPALLRHHEAVSQHRTGRRCRDKETSIATRALEKSVMTEISLSRQKTLQSYVAPVRAPLSQHKTNPSTQPPLLQHQNCVATQKPLLPSSLLQHQSLCRDRGPKEACRYRGLPRHA